ncbi:MAG TPA: DVU3141 family protein [Acetobacteraceae bacterium]|nr:DVU3141 family protein [Acetobacteraceae bacterium]
MVARVQCSLGVGGGLALLLLVAGCGPQAAPGSPDPAAPVAATDPVAIFAASSSPGAEGTVVIPETGQAVRVRLVRAYAAASGRECREVAVSGSPGSRVICRTEAGWIGARPLVSGGVPRS